MSRTSKIKQQVSTVAKRMEAAENVKGKPLNSYICAEIRRTYKTIPFPQEEAGEERKEVCDGGAK